MERQHSGGIYCCRCGICRNAADREEDACGIREKGGICGGNGYSPGRGTDAGEYRRLCNASGD